MEVDSSWRWREVFDWAGETLGVGMEMTVRRPRETEQGEWEDVVQRVVVWMEGHALDEGGAER